MDGETGVSYGLIDSVLDKRVKETGSS